MFGWEGLLLSLGSGVVEVSEVFGEVMMEAVGLEREGLAAELVVRMILEERGELEGELGDDGEGVKVELELVGTKRPLPVLLVSLPLSFLSFALLIPRFSVSWSVCY